MTDKEKLELIDLMMANVIEWTNYEKDSLDALLACISAVIEFENENDEQATGA